MKPKLVNICKFHLCPTHRHHQRPGSSSLCLGVSMPFTAAVFVVPATVATVKRNFSSRICCLTDWHMQIRIHAFMCLRAEKLSQDALLLRKNTSVRPRRQKSQNAWNMLSVVTKTTSWLVLHLHLRLCKNQVCIPFYSAECNAFILFTTELHIKLCWQSEYVGHYIMREFASRSRCDIRKDILSG